MREIVKHLQRFKGSLLFVRSETKKTETLLNYPEAFSVMTVMMMMAMMMMATRTRTRMMMELLAIKQNLPLIEMIIIMPIHSGKH